MTRTEPSLHAHHYSLAFKSSAVFFYILSAARLCTQLTLHQNRQRGLDEFIQKILSNPELASHEATHAFLFDQPRHVRISLPDCCLIRVRAVAMRHIHLLTLMNNSLKRTHSLWRTMAASTLGLERTKRYNFVYLCFLPWLWLPVAFGCDTF